MKATTLALLLALLAACSGDDTNSYDPELERNIESLCGFEVDGSSMRVGRDGGLDLLYARFEQVDGDQVVFARIEQKDDLGMHWHEEISCDFDPGADFGTPQ